MLLMATVAAIKIIVLVMAYVLIDHFFCEESKDYPVLNITRAKPTEAEGGTWPNPPSTYIVGLSNSVTG